MPTLTKSNFNIVSATLGGFVTLFGLVSYLLKERYYMGEARKRSEMYESGAAPTNQDSNLNARRRTGLPTRRQFH